MTEYCAEHLKLAVDLATIKETLQNIESKICNHVHDSDRPGGYRDRVVGLELSQNNLVKEISIIKSGYWKACIVSGVIGGLLGKLAPDFFLGILKLFNITG